MSFFLLSVSSFTFVAVATATGSSEAADPEAPRKAFVRTSMCSALRAVRCPPAAGTRARNCPAYTSSSW